MIARISFAQLDPKTWRENPKLSHMEKARSYQIPVEDASSPVDGGRKNSLSPAERRAFEGRAFEAAYAKASGGCREGFASIG